MTLVFADSGYWIALASPKDSHSFRAREVSKALGHVRMVTSEMVLTEVLSSLSSPPARALAVRLVDKIKGDPNVEVVPQTGQQFHEALTLYRSREDKEWSLVDCASCLIMKSKGIDRALAHDHHFAQMGFVVLLDDSEIGGGDERAGDR